MNGLESLRGGHDASWSPKSDQDFLFGIIGTSATRERDHEKSAHRHAKKEGLKIELQEFPVVKSVSD